MEEKKRHDKHYRNNNSMYKIVLPFPCPKKGRQD